MTLQSVTASDSRLVSTFCANTQHKYLHGQIFTYDFSFYIQFLIQSETDLEFIFSVFYWDFWFTFYSILIYALISIWISWKKCVKLISNDTQLYSVCINESSFLLLPWCFNLAFNLMEGHGDIMAICVHGRRSGFLPSMISKSIVFSGFNKFNKCCSYCSIGTCLNVEFFHDRDSVFDCSSIACICCNCEYKCIN